MAVVNGQTAEAIVGAALPIGAASNSRSASATFLTKTKLGVVSGAVSVAALEHTRATSEEGFVGNGVVALAGQHACPRQGSCCQSNAHGLHLCCRFTLTVVGLDGRYEEQDQVGNSRPRDGGAHVNNQFPLGFISHPRPPHAPLLDPSPHRPWLGTSRSLFFGEGISAAGC